MKKKSIAILLSAVMVFSMTAQSWFGLTAQAAPNDSYPFDDSNKWTGDSDLTPIPGWDTEEDKFTLDEYTGLEYTDVDGTVKKAVDVFSVNSEHAGASASSAPYDSVEKAIEGARDYKKEISDYVQFLTGAGEKWDLNVVQNFAEAEPFLNATPSVTEPAYSVAYSGVEGDGWNEVELPSSWTGQGYDFTIYTNVTMPFQTYFDPGSGSGSYSPKAPVNYNPVGFYRKTFTVDDGMLKDGKVFISFQGVESAYYIYLNGYQVGYAEDSYRPTDFDITEYLDMDGENTLVVQVHKFCDGTWMEDQDMLYDGGIFRDVFLYSTPYAHIKDYKVETALDETYTNAELKLDLDVRNYTQQEIENLAVDVRVFDENNSNIASEFIINVGDLAAGAGNNNHGVNDKYGEDFDPYDFTQSITINNPKLWSAETPNLYTLVLTLYDRQTGQYYESISQTLGFREVAFTSTQVNANREATTSEWDTMKINGQPLLLKGTNRHDRDPLYGKHIPKETALEDILLMKQYNFNALRTSHYPNDEYIYYLCDKYGIYVMSETNLECHAIAGNTTYIPVFRNLMLDRTNNHYQTLKNQSSVIMWSIGNEMGYNSERDMDYLFPSLVWFFKNRDTTRPVHSEGLDSKGGVDMKSNMYPHSIADRVGDGKIPYVMCEYMHAMGNSVGELTERYWQYIRQNENMIGAFVWDWVDQSMAMDIADVPDTYAINEISTYGAGVTLSEKKIGIDYVGGVVDADPASLTGKAATTAATVDSSMTETYNEYLAGAGSAYTFEVMVKPASTAAHAVMLAKGDTQIALKTSSNGQSIEWFFYDGDWRNTTAPIPGNWVGNWHHVAGTFDSTTGQTRIYIDGVLSGSGTHSGRYPNATGTALGVGYDPYNGRSFDGEISLARVYTRALSQTEVQAQASTTPAIGPDDSSVLFWLDYSEEITATEQEYWDYYADTENAHNNLYAKEMAGKFFGMGGDWGDTTNDYNFAQNGLISPDRTVQPELNELKYVYQSTWFTATEEQLQLRQVEVYNEFSFDNLSKYKVEWELLEDGEKIQGGELALDIAPRERTTITVPFNLPAKDARPAGAEYYLNFSVTLKEDESWADAGHEIGYEQLQIPATVEQAEMNVYTDDLGVYRIGNGPINVSGKTEDGHDFSFQLDTATGIIENYVFDSELLVEEGPAPNFWRATTNNDHQQDGSWQGAAANLNLVSAPAIDRDEDGRLMITTSYTIDGNAGAVLDIEYTINGNGEITVDYTLDPRSGSYGELLLVGTTMVLPAGYEEVQWYGNGGHDSFQDRKDSSKQGVWNNTVTDFFFPYLEVQDTGRLTDVKWITVTDLDKSGAVLVAGNNPLEASALHFTAYDMQAATHPYDLGAPREETILGIDMISKASGTSSCGPAPYTHNRLAKSNVYSYEFTIIPYKTSDSISRKMELSKPYRNVESGGDMTAQNMIDRIEQFVAYTYSQLADAENLLNTYANLIDENIRAEADAYFTGKTGKTGETLIKEIIARIKGMEGRDTYIEDKSRNELNPVLNPSMAALEYDAAVDVAMTGRLAVPNTAGEAGGDIFQDVIGGSNSWTVETYLNPGYSTDYNYDMIAGQGDNRFAVRSRANGSNVSLDFHTFNGTAWVPIEAAVSGSDWYNGWHLVTAVYDGSGSNGQLRLYLDGRLVGSATDSLKHVAASSYDFYVGYCPSSTDNRLNSNHFASTRVYNVALSAEDIAKQLAYTTEGTTPAYAPNADEVTMWLDYKEYVTGEDEVEPADLYTKLLEYAIQYADRVEREGGLNGIVPSVVTEFNSASAQAKEVLTGATADIPTVTQDDIDEAVERLINVIHMLDFKSIDKSDLVKLISMAEKYKADGEADETLYTKATFDALLGALETAKEVAAKELINVDEDIEELNEAYDSLWDAIIGLRYTPNKDRLNSLLTKAGTYDLSLYTVSTVKVFTEARNTANEVMADADADQDTIDAAADDLEEAMDGLKPLAAAGGNNGGVSGGNGSGGTSSGGADAGTASGSVSGASTGSAKSNPKTGDATLPAAFIIVLAVSGLALLVSRKKSR